MNIFDTNNETLKAAVQTAIFNTLTQEKRDELLKEAIRSLLVTKNKDQYGREQLSVIQEVYQDSVRLVASKIVNEHLNNDEKFKAQVRDLFHEAWERATAGGDVRNKIVENMSSAIAQSLTRDRW